LTSTWIEEQAIETPPGAPVFVDTVGFVTYVSVDAFGTSLAWAGTRLAVGAPGRNVGSTPADTEGWPTVGAVFIYAHDGSSWLLESQIDPIVRSTFVLGGINGSLLQLTLPDRGLGWSVAANDDFVVTASNEWVVEGAVGGFGNADEAKLSVHSFDGANWAVEPLHAIPGLSPTIGLLEIAVSPSGRIAYGREDDATIGSYAGAAFTTATQCGDGLDNDGDASIDSGDSDCRHALDLSEYELDGGDIIAVSFELPPAVYRIDPVTLHRTQIAGVGDVINPWGVGVGPDGTIFVTDWGFGEIRELGQFGGWKRARWLKFIESSSDIPDQPRSLLVEPDGSFVTTYEGQVYRFEAATGDAINLTEGTGGNTCETDVNDARYVRRDHDGTLLVSNGSPAGIYRISGPNLCSLVSFGSTITNPWGLLVEDSGSVLVSDATADAIVRFTPSILGDTIVHDGTVTFNTPRGLAQEADGQLLVADYLGEAIDRIELDAIPPTQTTLASSARYTDVAVLARRTVVEGDLLVADFGPTTGDTGSLIRVDPTSGEQWIVHRGAPFIDPIDVIVDVLSGDFFVSDAGAAEIFRVDAQTFAVTSYSSGGDLSEPRYLAQEPSGDLVVCDRGAQAVVRIDTSTQVASAIPGGPAVFNWCEGIDVGPTGMILAGDRSSGLVYEIEPVTNIHTAYSPGGPFTTLIDVEYEAVGQILAVDGMSMANEGRLYRAGLPSPFRIILAQDDQLSRPRGLTRGEGGEVWVMDRDNGVIRIDEFGIPDQVVISSSGVFDLPLGITYVPEPRIAAQLSAGAFLLFILTVVSNRRPRGPRKGSNRSWVSALLVGSLFMIAGLSTPARSSTLLIDTDASTYTVGDTITVTVTLDLTSGEPSSTLLAEIAWDPSIGSVVPGVTQPSQNPFLTSRSGLEPWVTDIGACTTSSSCAVLDQYNPEGPGFSPDLMNENVIGTLEIQADAPGFLDLTLEQITFAIFPPPEFGANVLIAEVVPVAQCINGVDDDGDGLLDTLDPDCVDSNDNSEYHVSPGDILAVSSRSPPALSRIDPVTGVRTQLMPLHEPRVLALGDGRKVYVADDTAEAIYELDLWDGRSRRVRTPEPYEFGLEPNIVLGSPRGLLVESSGHILFSAGITDEVIRIDPATGEQTVITTGGTCDLIQPSRLEHSPTGVAYVTSYDGHVYEIVLDNLCAQRSNGLSITGPLGLALEPDGQLLIGDNAIDQVVRFNPSTLSETPIHTGSWSFSTPFALALESDGKLLLADGTDNALYRLDVATGSQSTLSSGPRYFDVAVLPRLDVSAGDLLIADFGPTGGDTGALIRVDPATGEQLVVHRGAPFINPIDVVVDASSGDFFVSDSGAGAIFRVDAQSFRVTPYATGGDLVEPRYLEQEASGDLVVCDKGAQAVVRIDASTQVATAIPGGPAIFTWCEGIDVGLNGMILASDRTTDQLVEIDPATNVHTTYLPGGAFTSLLDVEYETADLVLAVDGLTTAGEGRLYRASLSGGARSTVAADDNLSRPRGIARSSEGELWVMDRDNGVIRIDEFGMPDQVVISSSGVFDLPLGITYVPEPAFASMLLGGCLLLVGMKQRTGCQVGDDVTTLVAFADSAVHVDGVIA
jgi:streptogramin lyase